MDNTHLPSLPATESKPQIPAPTSCAVASGWAIPFQDPRVLEAVTGVNRRSLELAIAISDAISAVGYNCTPQMEIEIGKRISNHIIGAEWPAAIQFYAASLPND